MSAWSEKTAVEATGGKARGSWQASRVEIDSRRVRPGDLFVALKGENFDGHDFVKDAFARGAVAAVVSHPPKGIDEDTPLVAVKDTQKALEALGAYARKRSRAQIIGVTGSVGKTSAKEMLKVALSAHGAVFATSGNYNNHIGTPLNLANLPEDVPFAVFEMGMNHAGEIARLTRLVQPHVAVITNVEAVHLEFFDSIESIARAKSEIFGGVPASGAAILNADSPQLTIMQGEAARCGIKRVVKFGERAGADCRLLSYKPTATGCEAGAEIEGKPLNYRLGAVGRHWALMSVMTLAVTHMLGLDDAGTARALAGFSEVEGRGRAQRIAMQGGEFIFIDDSYNASPAAMKAAFAKTAEVWEGAGGKGRKIAALGDMLELGSNSAALHAGLASDLRLRGFDQVFTAGKWMKHLAEALPASMRAGHVSQAADLAKLLKKELRPGDVLLVKGSHGSRMYELAKILLEAYTRMREKTHAV